MLIILLVANRKLKLQLHSSLSKLQNSPLQRPSFPRAVYNLLKCENRGFPGGAVVKNPPANAGGTGSSPAGSGKIPHAAEQLSLCTKTTDPAL